MSNGDDWIFHGTDSVAGCCGYDAMYEGEYTEQEYDDELPSEHDDSLTSLLSDTSRTYPLVFATIVHDSYYDAVIKLCVERKLHYVLLPTHLNPGSGLRVGMIVVYPKGVAGVTPPASAIA